MPLRPMPKRDGKTKSTPHLVHASRLSDLRKIPYLRPERKKVHSDGQAQAEGTMELESVITLICINGLLVGGLLPSCRDILLLENL